MGRVQISLLGSQHDIYLRLSHYFFPVECLTLGHFDIKICFENFFFHFFCTSPPSSSFFHYTFRKSYLRKGCKTHEKEISFMLMQVLSTFLRDKKEIFLNIIKKEKLHLTPLELMLMVWMNIDTVQGIYKLLQCNSIVFMLQSVSVWDRKVHIIKCIVRVRNPSQA